MMLGYVKNRQPVLFHSHPPPPRLWDCHTFLWNYSMLFLCVTIHPYIWGGRKYWMNCGKSRSRCNCKAVFTRYRHQLLLLLDEVDMSYVICNFIFFNFHKMAAILDDQKSLSITFLVISDQYATLFCLTFFYFGWPKITFDRFSCHFRSICNFIFFEFCLQNGRRPPFWMNENHFRWNFSPF